MTAPFQAICRTFSTLLKLVLRDTFRKFTPTSLECLKVAVRPEGADHQWRRIPPRELSIDLVADERSGRATGRAGAS